MKKTTGLDTTIVGFKCTGAMLRELDYLAERLGEISPDEVGITRSYVVRRAIRIGIETLKLELAKA